jgi:hypothetical protein
MPNFLFIIEHFSSISLSITEGKYLLVSGKSHRLGWKADLSSPYLFVTREINMTFWYYMNGAGMGNLSVIVTDRYGGKTNIWHKHGRQSADWQRATVSLDILTSFVSTLYTTRYNCIDLIYINNLDYINASISLKGLNKHWNNVYKFY